jgi:predicted CXXCH cytochrome family protein
MEDEMRLRTISLALAAAAIMVLGLAATGVAFHDGGVASCGSCHSMHNSANGVAKVPGSTQFQGVDYLLVNTDQSSTCLSCHGSGANRSGYHVWTALTDFAAGVPAQHTPGGDFTWLKVGTSTSTSTHDSKGHNIIAADFGLGLDSRLTESPGGNYPSASFNCISCHDPHGRTRITSTGAIVTPSIGSAVDPIFDSGSYGDLPTAGKAVGVYRILGGANYKPDSITDNSLAFATTAPVAVAPSSYNVTIGDVPVAYGQGMSEWCANCHSGIHNDQYPTNLRHPSGNNADLTAGVVANYNAYVMSGDLSGTGGSTAYWPLVPFEHGEADLATLLGYTTTSAEASTSKNVMCLSCHRAHASGFNSMLRWNNTFMVVGGVYANPAGGFTAAQTLGAYYDKPASDFASEQRSLCNKCHAKD